LKDSSLSERIFSVSLPCAKKEYPPSPPAAGCGGGAQQVKAVYDYIRIKVVSEVIVRRTRRDLMEHGITLADFGSRRHLPKHREPEKSFISFRRTEDPL